MSIHRALSTLSCLCLLSACPNPDPPHRSDGELREGRWTVRLQDARVEGHCGELQPGELDGQVLSATVEVDGPRVWMDLEGLQLRGRFADRWLELAGAVDAELPGDDDGDVGTVVDDDDAGVGGAGDGEVGDGEVGDGDASAGDRDPEDCGAPEDDACGGDGDPDGPPPTDMVVHLGAEVPAPVLFDGLLELDVAVTGGRCHIGARAIGRHVDEDGGAQPGAAGGTGMEDGDGAAGTAADGAGDTAADTGVP